MIKFITKEEIEKLISSDSIIIVPSYLEYYYKDKYYKMDYDILSFNKFILKIYGKRKKMVGDKEAFIIMREAFLKCASKLIRYKDVKDFDFIKELLSTYEVFDDYELLDNDKTHDLHLIFDTYDSLLNNHGLISKALMLKELIEGFNYDKKLIFLGLEDFSKLEIDFIKKLKVDGQIYVYYDGYNEKLLRKIDDDYWLSNKLPRSNASIYALNDTEDEVNFVLNDISKKVLDGAKYNEFVITSLNVESYEPYFDMILSVPHSKKLVTGLLTTRFINVLKNIFTGDFSNKNFLNLLRLDVLDVPKEVINQIDNYVYVWNLEEESFYEPYTKECKGINLEAVNDVKNEIINQIRYLLENVHEVNDANVIAKEFWTYVEQNGIDERLFKHDKEGYNDLVSALESINDYVKEISFLCFFELLSNLVSCPKKVNYMTDEVLISNLGEVNLMGRKYVYFLGASESNFPGKLSLAPLVTDKDLKESSLTNLTDDFSFRTKASYLSLLNCKNLIITYPKLSLELKLNTLSSVIKGKVIKENENLYNERLIKLDYANKLSCKKVYKEEVKDDDIKRVNLLESRNLNLMITKENAKLLYTNNISISPSSIEAYAKCPFYFYCQYGLRLNVKEKNSFDNREIGSLVHYVLQRAVMSKVEDINLSKIGEDALDYLKSNDKIINNTVKYLVSTLTNDITLIIKNMIKENKVTAFRPCFTEFRIDDNALIKSVVIKLDEGTLKLSGIVDRIDAFKDDNNTYFRVIDYKTGGKKLRLDDCLEALNLQLFLYLMAVKESDKNAVLGAVLYYPALVKEKGVSRALTKEELEKSVQERLLMDGVINANPNVIKALGEDDMRFFIDVFQRGKINDEKLFTDDNLNDLFLAIKRKLKEIGDEILAGNIKVSPVAGRVNACDFCKFSSICTFDREKDKVRFLKNYKNSEVFEMLGGDKNA